MAQTRRLGMQNDRYLKRRGFRIGSPELFSRLQSEARLFQAGAEACE